MNRYFAIGCMWLSVAIVSFNSEQAAVFVGFFAMMATIVLLMLTDE